MPREQGRALVALGLVVIITAAWWALALWPLAAEAPGWLARARYVCFGTADGGLPDAAGWTALVLQPALMLGLVGAIWGSTLTVALRGVARGIPGRVTLAAVGLVLAAAVTAAGGRVVTVGRAAAAGAVPDRELPAPSYPRLDRPAPPFALVDQHGDVIGTAALRGRVVLVTFAYAHCETVCPVVVRDVLEARRRLAGSRAVSAVVVTLDPWRDVPARLPAIASRWSLREGEHVLSGELAAVEAALDAWGVARLRDALTGEVTHPRLVYVVDADGTIAYAASGGPAALTNLVERL